MEQESEYPVWFFVGALLLAYGIIVFAASLLAPGAPSPVGRIAREAGVAWGIVLILFGALFAAVFHWKRGSPRSRQAPSTPASGAN